MNNKPLFQLPLSEISTLEQFLSQWKNTFKRLNTPKNNGPFYLNLKLGDDKEIHLADLHQHPATLSPLAITHIFNHWQIYLAYYSPLNTHSILFYV